MQVENEKRATEVIKWRSNQRKLAEQEEALVSIQEGRQADRKVYEEFRLQKLKSGHLRSKGVFTGNHSEARAILDERMRPRTENKVSIVVRCDVDGRNSSLTSSIKQNNSLISNPAKQLHADLGKSQWGKSLDFKTFHADCSQKNK